MKHQELFLFSEEPFSQLKVVVEGFMEVLHYRFLRGVYWFLGYLRYQYRWFPQELKYKMFVAFMVPNETFIFKNERHRNIWNDNEISRVLELAILYGYFLMIKFLMFIIGSSH